MSGQTAPSLPTDLAVAVAEAVEVLRQGGVVVYPTDTVYGLGADAFNEAAVERVFEIKGRPAGLPIPLLLGSLDQLLLAVEEVPPLARKLAGQFWPGALTLALPKAPGVPALVSARGWTVGVRVPGHPVPRELARLLGRPITGTSANQSGGPSPRTAEEARTQVGGLVDLVIDGGPAPLGRESTVLDLTGPVPRILREGAVPKEALEGFLGLTLAVAAPPKKGG